MATKSDKDQLAKGAADIAKAKKDTAKAKPTTSGTMEIHPVAKMFPPLPAKEMRELKNSIETNGIEVPILVNKSRDTIIDGRNRYMVAMDLGFDLSDPKQVPMEVFKGTEDEIANVVLMRNVFRRHLTPDQRVAMIAKVRVPQLEAEAADRKAKKGTFGAPAATDGKKGTVAEAVAKEADVTLHKAKQAVKGAKAGKLTPVIEKKKSLKDMDKEVPSKKRAPAKELTFEEQIVDKFDSFVKGFAVQQRRRVKEIVYGILIEQLAPSKK